jgi:hypothetical protein
MPRKKPVADAWYADEEGRSFMVVGVDEDEETVEIQYSDGDIEEIDLDAWYAMSLTGIEVPDDWSGALDELKDDDTDLEDELDDDDDDDDDDWDDIDDLSDFDDEDDDDL